ncbi:hypothetical protein [Sinisalibacter aestuarii]|uniref:CNP1-like uncharacterized domain-containing protein n=1 Tax=Sinisalibacter aestuarii TaxID=2949426 RepID=A0ABQ5LSM2_9RHOB|nr:hypothetical protein [Sinisalibacter aestuarii]GKY87987.1 hypothetical protein STA1M1_18560 [Sinisalibacter aestuarii]
MVRILVALSLVLGLTACSDGNFSLNPFNWFTTPGEEDWVALEPEGGWDATEDRRLVVDQVTALRIERTTAGVIVHATGLPPRLGYWDAELEAENDGEPVNGVMSYRFRIATPRWATAASTPYARTVHVAQFISNAELRDVRTIRVVGERNALTAGR